MEEKKENNNGAGAESRREAQLARLRKRHPEKKFEDEEEIFGQISDDYDAYEAENGAMKEREKALSDMFRADPRSAYMLNDMREGRDPVMGLVRRFGMEVKDILDDPEMQDKIEAANKEYLERVAKSRELEEEYEKNMDSTLALLAKHQESAGLSDEEIDRVAAAWLQIVKDGVMGKLTEETITLLGNALSHDTDVEKARKEGEVLGKNTRIVEKLRERQKGDGLQNLGGSNNAEGTRGPRGRKSMFDWAQEAT